MFLHYYLHREEMIKNPHFKIFRISVIVSAIIAIALIFFFISIHFLKFNDSLSSKLTDWSNFGAYFSGTVGVILSALNFFIISYLTVKIYRNHDQQWLTQLRSPFYKDIIEKAYFLTDDKLKDQDTLRSFVLWLENTDFKNLLFLVDNKEETTLNSKRKILLQTLKEIESRNKYISEVDVQLVDKFHLHKIDFTNYLGKIMMDKTRE